MKFRLTLGLILSAITLALLFVTRAEAKAWRGIVPLHSTRTDVDRLIGYKKQRCGGNSCLYDLGDDTVFILYADEPTCKNDDAATAWKVPRDTVIEIDVHFKTERKLTDLGLDLTRYTRVEDQELRGWVYYINREEGVEIEGSDKTASGINYYQEAKDNNLRCPALK